MTLATRIGVMDRGQIVQVGTPAEVYEFPNTRFVADFIGSANLFEGQLVEDLPQRVAIRSDELGCLVHVNHGISAAPQATVWVAIRPEKILLSRQMPPHAASGNCVRGTVQEIAYMGDLSVYLVKLDGGRIMRVTLPNTERLPDSDRITWEETVYLSWSEGSPVVLTQ